jgi:transcriptional regulator GlxA family with amidase domain
MRGKKTMQSIAASTGSSIFSIGMLLLDGFNSMAMQAFLDPFRSANYLRGTTLYHWQFLGLDGANVTASNGLHVGELKCIEQTGSQFDLVVVNASWGWKSLMVERF